MEHETWRKSRFNYPAHVPTMISREERLYLYWLGETVWSGQGIVVEIGPWLGGSTVCLAAGMQASGHDARKRLHSFDNFIWREFMAARVQLPIKPGDSFRSYFLKNIRDYEEVVEPHVYALPDEYIDDDSEAAGKRFSELDSVPILEEPTRDAVEILFIDGAKSWRGMRHLLRVFRERLIPGSSYLVCQDYKYWGTYWVPVMMRRLSEYFEPAHNVVGATTVAFRLVSAIPHELLDEMEDRVGGMPTEQTLADIDRVASLLADDGDPLGSINTRLAKVSFLSHQGRVEAAAEEFRKIQKAWPTFSMIDQLERAREYLRTEKSMDIPRSGRLEFAILSRKARTRLARGVLGKLSRWRFDL